MKRTITIPYSCIAITAILFVFSEITLSGQSALKAGAAKVDITPQSIKGFHNVWGTEYTGVHDNVYLRCLLLENESQKTAIITLDLGGVPFGLEILGDISKRIGIPENNIIICGTHVHDAPIDFRGDTEQARSWKASIKESLFKALDLAKGRMQPAKLGVGSGEAYLNINRDEYTVDGWKLGNNPGGPSDKTVRVLQVTTLDDKPIAVFVNYAVHAVVLGPKNDQATADLPGATSTYIERELGNEVVALWTSGAAGDQNPVYMGWDTTYGKDINKDGFKILEALGVVLGEEVLRVCKNMDSFSEKVTIHGMKKVVECPRKELTPEQAARYTTPPSNIVKIKLDLLLINEIALTGVSGEIETPIYMHLLEKTPLKNTIMITHTPEGVGYVCADANYDRATHQVRATPVIRGYAENGIVDNLVNMINEGLKK
jgi:hypothetical protein